MTRWCRRAVHAVVVAAVSVVVPVLAAVPAVAAGCSRVMSVGSQFPSGSGILITPSKVAVHTGDCVGFTNNTVPAATITVSGGYSVTLGYGESTTASNSYQAKSAGSFAVTATNGPASAHGSIAVRAAPAPSPSPSPSPTQSAPQPRPQPTASVTSGSGPQIAPTPRRATSPPAALPPPTPLASTSALATPSAGNPSVAPTPTPSTSAVAVVAGPLQPPTDRGFGLPAALAALAVVGVAAALLRVLLAHAPTAVDSRGTVGPAA